MRSPRVARATGSVVVAAGLLLAGLVTATPPAAGAPTADCYDDALPITVEEQRLTRPPGAGQDPMSEQALVGTDLDGRVARFVARLCDQDDYADARRFVRRKGTALWSAAVERAQSDDPAGSLPASDDRGLYWARISMAKAIHQYAPASGLSDKQRARLSLILERTSRGITTSEFDGDGARPIVVTGFDPFTLDQDIRIGNPSGANALPLDGARMTVGGQTYEIQTMVFPVRYADFDERMVEKALRPHYRDGTMHADLVMTASQGRVGYYDLEVWNGRRRSVSAIGDNNNEQGGGTYTDPVVPPRMPEGPEFLETSLPVDDMVTAGVAPFGVRINTRVVEIPAGEEDPVSRPDGPTEGSTAVEGGGGGYLSNEIAYRNTLLRDRVDPTVPAGHLHVPVLRFAADNPTSITDPTYEANREAIIAGARKILRKALATL